MKKSFNIPMPSLFKCHRCGKLSMVKMGPFVFEAGIKVLFFKLPVSISVSLSYCPSCGFLDLEVNV